MKTITVKVTQEHIDKGIACDCEFCPLALALHDMGLTEAIVGVDDWVPEHHGDELLLPPKARKFVSAFDYGYNVEPTEIELFVPEVPA